MTDSHADGQYAIVAAQFNRAITEQLLVGAQQAFAAAGVDPDQVQCVWVPGAFEIPLACQRLAKSGRLDAIIALGAVIRGATPHFDFIAAECARGIAEVGLQSEVPVIFGVLTTDTIDQAQARADPAAGNKGGAAATAAMEMVALLHHL